MNFETAKAGWLFRQSTILKRWKRNWFVLYTDGTFKYFDDPRQSTAEDVIEMNIDCTDVFSEVHNVTPPNNLDISCLLSMRKSNGDIWILCAENLDDKKAWEFVLNDARLLQPYVPPPPYTVVHPHHETYDVGMFNQLPTYYQQQQRFPYDHHYQNQLPSNTTTIIYANQPPYYYRRPLDGTDVAMGVVAGAAVSSMLWGPLLWW